MVLEELGALVAEAQVRHLIGHTRLGVSLAIAQRKLSNAGAVVQRHEDWNLDDLRDALRAGYYPIVGVERHLLGYPRAFHAVVLAEITSTAIAALDPLDGPDLRHYGEAAFMSAWEIAGREVLVIETLPSIPCKSQDLI
jgi:hypothetical protein